MFCFLFMLPALARLVRFSYSSKRKRNRLLRKRVGGSSISYSVSEIWLILRLGYWILENWRGRCGIVIIFLAPYKRDTRIRDLIIDEKYREMLLKRTGIPYSRKKKTFLCILCILWKILLIVAVKGFVYRFMFVRVREKMAGKVIRHPDSVFERLATKNI